jgi:hypothetical protein
MARAASCPSCGAQVAFRAAGSVLAVCEFCRSTLLRKGADLENLGKMAELAEDTSLVRLGTEGRYQGVHFAVIGRIQLRYGQGIWNEWHLLYDSQRTGWLGEGYGRTFMTHLKAVKEPIPPFSDLKVGTTVTLDGKSFSVAGLDTAKCVAGEGELPFKVGAGYDVQTADLYGGAYFATIDYSETPPFVFIGEQVDPVALKLTHTRDPATVAVAAEAIQCTGCGAPLTVHGAAAIETIACGSCGSVLDASDKSYKVIQKMAEKRPIEPVLPLGSKGRLHGADYEVIGFMVRKIEVDGMPFRWSEYLLFNPVEGFRWLTVYRGHWNFVKAAKNPPTRSTSWNNHPLASYLGQPYKHFQSATAHVDYVLGEFYWRVQVGDSTQVADYINPPLMVSAESTDKELVWSVSEYIEPEAVAQAFKIKMPMPLKQGVFANQPAPVVHGRYWAAFALLSLAALVVHLVFYFGGGQKVYDKRFVVQPRSEQTLQTEVFDVHGRASNVLVRSDTDLSNGWAFFNISLVEADKGTVYRLGREVSYYSGSDWSEGSRSDEAIFTRVPAGRYYLSVDAEVHPERVNPLYNRLQVLRDVPAWSNLWILLGLLLVIPLIVFFRKSAFETARWAESDHAPEPAEDDDDC